ncbi:MAG: DUF1254 domain-containing protein [Methanomassiliicoccus sp.]|nr:DUF1254 domain-containing protein [Methanomassiliicoccus sp.]
MRSAHLVQSPRSPSSKVDVQEIHEIGIEAYHYLYPLILMDITRRVTTNHEPGTGPSLGMMNAFSHMSAFPRADFREVVRPNFDTLYSSAWLDLTEEPMVVTAPDTAGRYYLLPMLDMWTDVFAVPGKRTSGTGEGHWAVVPPRWSGSLPDGMLRIEAPTPYVWIIGRTQTNGPKDYDAVHEVQSGFLITPLSQWGKPPSITKTRSDPGVDMQTPPMVQVATMSSPDYFSYGAELMKLHPPHSTDWSQIERFRRIGLEPGKSFDLDGTAPEIKDALEKATADGLKGIREGISSFAPIVNGWQMIAEGVGVYGNAYFKRAIIAMIGLGANPPEDAIYLVGLADAGGNPLDGSNRYVLHFDRDELPPMEAFWSLTMYDSEGFQVANGLDRFAIGDRDDLIYSEDGSLDIYIQSESPGADKESNWLPSPANGRLGLTMRIYAPKARALDGRWVPPSVRRS